VVDLVTGGGAVFIGRDSDETVFTPNANIRRRFFFDFHFDNLIPAAAGRSS
jgi:hypothetical protein